MSKQTARRYSQGEISILRMLWEEGEATLSEAHRAMEARGHQVGYTTVQTRLERLVGKKAIAKSRSRPAKYSAAVAELEAGDQTRALAAIDNVQPLGDEGVVLLALAASRSGHEAVRRKALQKALELGTAGYPALAHITSHPAGIGNVERVTSVVVFTDCERSE